MLLQLIINCLVLYILNNFNNKINKLAIYSVKHNDDANTKINKIGSILLNINKKTIELNDIKLDELKEELIDKKLNNL